MLVGRWTHTRVACCGLGWDLIIDVRDVGSTSNSRIFCSLFLCRWLHMLIAATAAATATAAAAIATAAITSTTITSAIGTTLAATA